MRPIDKIIGPRLEGRVPSVTEILYFMQNCEEDNEDAAAILDRKGPGIYEGCHRVAFITDVDDFREV